MCPRANVTALARRALGRNARGGRPNIESARTKAAPSNRAPFRAPQAHTAPTASPPGVAPVAWRAELSHDVGLRGIFPALTDVTKVLVVAAHPDDEMIGAGRLIAELTAAGHTVAALTLTAGEACAGDALDHAEVASLRNAEWCAALSALGAEPVATEALPDGAVQHRIPEATQTIRTVVEHMDAALILSTWRHDPHPDHAAAGDAAAAAARALGVPLVKFPVWATHWMHPREVAAAGWRIRRVATSDAAAAARNRALDAYASQLTPLRPDWPPVVPEEALAAHPGQLLCLRQEHKTVAGPDTVTSHAASRPA